MISVLKSRYLFTSIFLIIGFVLWLTYPRYYEFNGPIFGTYYKVIVVAPKYSVNESELSHQIRKRLAELDSFFSTYRSDSDVSDINNAQVDQSVIVNFEVVNLIRLSQNLKNKLGNVWDPTIAPVSKKYGFDTVSGMTGKVIGLEYLEVINDTTVIKRDDISLDFSSIAKGYAVDQLSLMVNVYSIKGAYVDIGGEIKTTGKKSDNKPWGIGIQSPTKYQEILQVLYSNNMAIATSGNYLNKIEKNDQVIGHILDPRTKKPIKHQLLSVSVIAADCAVADALATGIYVMGPVDAKKWLEEFNQYPALLVYKERGTVKSEFVNGFDRFLDPEGNSAF